MATLAKDLITRPALWRMALCLRRASLDVVLSSPYDEGPLVYRTLKFDEHLEPLAAFEEAVYENPLLLSDFSRTDILIDTPRFTIAPSEVGADDVRQGLLRALWPDEALSVVAVPMHGTGETLLLGLDEGVRAFLARTFLDSAPGHPVSTLASYFAPMAEAGNAPGRFFVNLRADGADVIGFVGGKLCVANAYAAATPEDTAYFVLASAQTADFPLEDGEIMLCGDMKARQQVAPILRDFAHKVMPAVFPSEALRLGPDAVKAPFPLIISNIS